MARTQPNSTLFGTTVLCLSLVCSASFCRCKLCQCVRRNMDSYIEKSRFHPGPPMRRETLIITEAAGLLHVTD